MKVTDELNCIENEAENFKLYSVGIIRKRLLISFVEQLAQ